MIIGFYGINKKMVFDAWKYKKVNSKGLESKINFNINIDSLEIRNEFNYQYNLSKKRYW